jgi:hypothetical protein
VPTSGRRINRPHLHRKGFDFAFPGLVRLSLPLPFALFVDPLDPVTCRVSDLRERVLPSLRRAQNAPETQTAVTQARRFADRQLVYAAVVIARRALRSGS